MLLDGFVINDKFICFIDVDRVFECVWIRHSEDLKHIWNYGPYVLEGCYSGNYYNKTNS